MQLALKDNPRPDTALLSYSNRSMTVEQETRFGEMIAEHEASIDRPVLDTSKSNLFKPNEIQHKALLLNAAALQVYAYLMDHLFINVTNFDITCHTKLSKHIVNNITLSLKHRGLLENLNENGIVKTGVRQKMKLTEAGVEALTPYVNLY